MPEHEVMDSALLDSYQQLIRYNKAKLIELLKSIADLHYFYFQQTNIYSNLTLQSI
jgi:hypothetical protein